MTLAFLVEAYDEQTIEGANGKEDTRTVLHFHPALAPYKAAVLPLTKNRRRKPKNSETSWRSISLWITIFLGSTARDTEEQDEIGTPYCITVDPDTENDGCVTVRDRDSMEQIRIPMGDVKDYIAEKLVF